MPLPVRERSPARNALLFEESFQDAVPGMKVSYIAFTYSIAFAVSGESITTFSLASVRLPPCDHRAQCAQVLPSPVACPSGKPAGVLFFLSALQSSRKPAVSPGTLSNPAFFTAETR